MRCFKLGQWGNAIFVLLAVLFGGSAQSASVAGLHWELDAQHAVIDEAKLVLEKNSLEDHRTLVKVADRTRVDMKQNTVSTVHEAVYFYPTTEAVQNSGYERIVWDPDTEELTVLCAVTIRTDGTVTAMDPNTAEVMDTDSYNLFTDRQQLILTLPGLEKGGVSVRVYRIDSKDKLNYLLVDWVGSSGFTMEQLVEVNWTDDAPAWHLDDTSAMSCDVGEKQLLCLARDIAPIQQDANVSYQDVVPSLQVATQTSWSDVVSRMQGLVAEATSNREALSELLTGFGNSKNPLAAVHDLTARQIRYVSFSEGEHTHRPHDVEDTLKRRYGDCKDKSALMYALLEELGYDAYPVLVSTERFEPRGLKLPSRGFFDHMVVCTREDAVERCFDPTNVHSGIATTPLSVQGAVRLSLLPGAVPGVLPVDEHRWQVVVDSKLSFNAEGGQ